MNFFSGLKGLEKIYFFLYVSPFHFPNLIFSNCKLSWDTCKLCLWWLWHLLNSEFTFFCHIHFYWKLKFIKLQALCTRMLAKTWQWIQQFTGNSKNLYIYIYFPNLFLSFASAPADWSLVQVYVVLLQGSLSCVLGYSLVRMARGDVLR